MYLPFFVSLSDLCNCWTKCCKECRWMIVNQHVTFSPISHNRLFVRPLQDRNLRDVLECKPTSVCKSAHQALGRSGSNVRLHSRPNCSALSGLYSRSRLQTIAADAAHPTSVHLCFFRLSLCQYVYCGSTRTRVFSFLKPANLLERAIWSLVQIRGNISSSALLIPRSSRPTPQSQLKLLFCIRDWKKLKKPSPA